jgi:hypothetical protein
MPEGTQRRKVHRDAFANAVNARAPKTGCLRIMPETLRYLLLGTRQRNVESVIIRKTR